MKFEKFAVIPALATMLNKYQEFDENSQRKLIRHLLDKNIDGFYIGGATGEGFLMSPEERKRVISVSIDEINGRVPMIAYTGSNDTKTAIELSKFAEKEGADAISSVRPYYGGFSSNLIKEYYLQLCTNVKIPLIIYNNSNAQLSDLDEILDILSIENCGGIKYTLTNHFEMKLIKCNNKDKLVFSGVDEMMASAIIAGVDGAIGTTYNVFPELFLQMRDAFEKGNVKTFSKLNEVDVRLVNLFIKRSIIGCMKAILEMFGLGYRYTRLPNHTLSSSELENFKCDLRKLKEEYDISGIQLFEEI